MNYVLPGTYQVTAPDGHSVNVVLFLNWDGSVQWNIKRETE